MPASLKSLLAAANAAVPRITPAEALGLVAQQNALLLDVRDAAEVEHAGKIQGAKHVSRGLLEFRADPGQQYHDPEFRKDRPVIIYCDAGGRSALAGLTLTQMGYKQVFNLGGFKDAAGAGCTVEFPGIVDTELM